MGTIYRHVMLNQVVRMLTTAFQRINIFMTLLSVILRRTIVCLDQYKDIGTFVTAYNLRYVIDRGWVSNNSAINVHGKERGDTNYACAVEYEHLSYRTKPLVLIRRTNVKPKWFTSSFLIFTYSLVYHQTLCTSPVNLTCRILFRHLASRYLYWCVLRMALCSF